jgi:phage-related protein
MSHLQENIGQIKYTSIARVGIQVRSLDIKHSEIGKAMSYALELSHTKAYRLARGLLSTVPEIESFKRETTSLISWARDAGVKERKMIAKVIRKDKGDEGDIYLVHSISGMKKKDARAFMVDYLKSGGSTKAITEWLAMANSALKKHLSGEPIIITRGIIGWIEDTVSSAGSALADGIGSVVDAVTSAGKSLVDMVGDVMKDISKWTADKIGDLVTALIDAGKSLGDILKAALEKGASAMRKFVEAIIKVGKSIGEIVKSALEMMAKNISSVLKALLEIGKSIADIVKSVHELTIDILGNVLKGLIEIGQSIGKILKSIINSVSNLLQTVLKSLFEIGKSIGKIISSISRLALGLVDNVVNALISMGRTLADIIQNTIKLTMDMFTNVVKALIKLGKTISELFKEAINTVYNGIKLMAEALVRLGKKIIDIVLWAIDNIGEMLKDILAGILSAGKAVVDILASIVSKSINIIKKILKAFIELGEKVVNLLKDAIRLGIEFTRKFITSVTEIAGVLLRFSTEVLKFTYKTAASLVKNLLDAGVTVIEVLGMVVGASYLVFRRMINGIIQNTGSLGEVLDWVLTQGEEAVSKLWHETLLAIRYAKGKLTEAIDWAVNKGSKAMEELLRAWESINESLIDFYTYAAEMAKNGTEKLFEYIGNATVKLENSVDYVLTYLEKDYIIGIRDFIEGVLNAGYALSELFIHIAGMTLEAFTEVIKSTLEYGVTLSELIIETIKNPEDILDNFMKAVEEAGKSLQDIYQAVIIDLSEEFIEEVTLAFYKMKKAVIDILHAVAEIYMGAIGTVISILLNTLGSYRPMRADEVVQARLIYGDTFDYSTIYFSQESLLNDIIFGIQDWASGEKNSRAFVSNTLVNFDVDDGDIEYDTMIHELCHVWQYNDTGAFYMSEAIHAQTFGDGYNYGYSDSENGERGEDDLLNAINDNPNLDNREVFELFNREQQAQIIMHYYVRRYRTNPSANYTAWEPFQALVYA